MKTSLWSFFYQPFATLNLRRGIGLYGILAAALFVWPSPSEAQVPSGLYFSSGNSVYSFNANGPTLYATGFQGETSGAQQLTFDSSGDLFVVNSSAGAVTEVTPNGVQSTYASGLNSPVGAVFDSAGNLYVDGTGGSIYKITPNGSTSVIAILHVSPFEGMAIDGSGDLFTVNPFNGEISTLNSNGTSISGPYYLTSPGAHQLVIDANGNLFVNESDPNLINEYKTNGSSGAYTPLLNGVPVGLALDKSGDLFVGVDYYGAQGYIYEFPAGGGTPSVTSLGSIIPNFLTYVNPTAVPEPSSMLLLASGGLGSFWKYRPRAK